MTHAIDEGDGLGSGTDLKSRFWRFSLDVYARPQVDTLSLMLQDHHGFDVNVIMFCLWLAHTRHLALDRASLEQLQEAITPLNNNLILPIRSARRWLKEWVHSSSNTVADRSNYRSLKSLELKFEQQVQHVLVDQLDKEYHGAVAVTAHEAALLSLKAYADVAQADAETIGHLDQLVLKAIT